MVARDLLDISKNDVATLIGDFPPIA